MPSLEAIGGWELAIVASVAGARGPLEERDRQVARSGLYGEYAAILGAYAEHLDRSASATEALRRAIFIVWQSGAAPACLTGIGHLPARTVRTVVDALERRVALGGLDDETGAMLARYHATCGIALALHDMPQALAAIEDVAPDAWRTLEPRALDPHALEGRGQMGRWWLALLGRPRLAASPSLHSRPCPT